MEGASKDLLQMEKNQPSLFESSLIVCKEGEAEVEEAQRKAKRGKKEPSAEEIQRAVPSFSSSGVLGRVKDFLGAMAEANDKLQTAVQVAGREDFDIEALTGNENEYIELDLLLGLTDLHTPEAVAAAEAAVRGGQPPLSPSASESSSSSEEEEAPAQDSARPACPNRGRKRPNITVLD